MIAKGESGNLQRLIASMMVAAALAVPVAAQVTRRASVDSSGAEANGASDFTAVSADGRYVGFNSLASNLVAGDTNAQRDIFLRDRQSGITERVSVDSSGAQANDQSFYVSISADGRYAAFDSSASNLVAGDTNGVKDIFLRDRQNGTTVRVSVDSSGAEGNGDSEKPSISADGRYVAFESAASNLVVGDTNGARDVFVRDVQLGTTARVSVGAGGVEGSSYSVYACISGDGRYVAFRSAASNLVSGDTNGVDDVFVHDRQMNTTERVSVTWAGGEGDRDSYSPSVSADGRFVAFESGATNLVPGGSSGFRNIFVRDRQSGNSEEVSLDSSGVEANNNSYTSSISADGRWVSFESLASNLVTGDTNGFTDVFLRDRQSATTEMVSVSSGGSLGTGDSFFSSISPDGRFVAFVSSASDLVAGDTNTSDDIFVHDRNATGFTSLCDPGFDGVIACPCSNAPGGPGRGCDNSSSTGGASLSAAGIAYLSMDSLAFTTSAEEPTAVSILLQGGSYLSSGQIYGRGVRCVGGSLIPLFTKNAAGGSITAPDFGAGDPTVSARAAASGDVIQPGQSRYYFVFYRDPLGACPIGSPFVVHGIHTVIHGFHTFNVTQTGQVTWSM